MACDLKVDKNHLKRTFIITAKKNEEKHSLKLKIELRQIENIRKEEEEKHCKFKDQVSKLIEINTIMNNSIQNLSHRNKTIKYEV